MPAPRPHRRASSAPWTNEQNAEVRILLPVDTQRRLAEENADLYAAIAMSILRAPSMTEAMERVERLRPAVVRSIASVMAVLDRYPMATVSAEATALAKRSARSSLRVAGADYLLWQHVIQTDATSRDRAFALVTPYLRRGATPPDISAEAIADMERQSILVIACMVAIRGIVRPRTLGHFRALLDRAHLLSASHYDVVLRACGEARDDGRLPPLRVDRVTARARWYRFSAEMAVDVSRHGTNWLVEVSDLGIISPGSSARDALTGFVDQLDALWDGLVCAPDAQLTRDARDMKRRLAKLVRLGA